MIKNIYDKNNKRYTHEYYCDNCLLKIRREIFRNEKAIKNNKFDLCKNCLME